MGKPYEKNYSTHNTNNQNPLKEQFGLGLHCFQRAEYTVNFEIFARVLFSRNFAYAKFRENKISTNWGNHSVVY